MFVVWYMEKGVKVKRVFNDFYTAKYFARLNNSTVENA
jgi:hypothetical protein